MDTLIGQTLSHYRIVEKIGAGGMGEVYRARDTRLGRDVAIKALPAAFSSNPDRLLRFEREAKVLASLNHPNLAAIHGMEEIEGHRYLALEYVEGETLAARLARGPLPLEETIGIGIQIASGMEAAHERGVIHRDLKPGNVMITPGDQVKVVDFGLAKEAVSEPEEVSPDSPTVTDSPALAYSPTIRTPATLPGVILGTAAYLSPEQARGKVVDRRTDIWAFGCVVYECLTGRPAFEGETVSDVIARILRSEPDWERLPGGVPPAMRALLRRCLEKDPLKRLRDMGDARLALEEIREGKGAGEIALAPRFLSQRVIALGVAVALLSGAAGIVLWNRVHPAATGLVGVRRASIEIPGDIQVTRGAVTPDGEYLIVEGRPRPREGEQPARPRLYRRRMDSTRFDVIEGSEGVSGVRASPDGRWLYFTKPISEGTPDQHLVKTLLHGSAAPVAVANWGEGWDLSSWVPLGSGDVLVGLSQPRGFGGTAYVRVPANGAASSAPVRFDTPGFNGTFQFEEVLPRDRGVLLNTVSYAGGRWQWGVAVLDLRSGKTKILFRDCGNASYVRTGHLVYARGSTLLGVPFDLSSLAIRGEPAALVEGLRSTFSGVDPGLFTLSKDGTLVYRPGGMIGAHRHLIVVDGQGRVSNWTPDSAAYIGPPRGSPDGRRVACTISNNARGLSEIWMSERGRPLQRVVAVLGMDCGTPVWSPDGNQIAFSQIGSTAGEGIYVQSLGGGAPRRICRFPDSTAAIRPTSWSPDGKYLLATATGEGGGDVVRVATAPPGGSLSAPVALITGPELQTFAQYSPDGRYVAYRSDESGRGGIYVAPIRPDLSLGTPVFAGRGSGADWSKSGRELFILTSRFDQNPRNRVVSVSIQRDPVLSASAPVPRWDADSLRAGLGGDILRGDLLLNIQRGADEDERDVTSLTCVFNFFDEMKQRIREARNR